MIRATAKIIRVCFYSAIILMGVTFAVSNRGSIDLTFYPIPYVLTMPLFLFAILLFSLGIGLGWIIARFGIIGHRRAHKQATKRVVALENELGALRTERLVQPAAKALLSK